MRTSKPKILVVIARLNVGGTAQYIEKLVNGLNSNGFDAVIATGYVQGSEREDPRVSGLPIMRIPSLGRKISPIQDLKAWLELRKTVKTFQPDLIYSHTFKAGLLVRTIFTSTRRVHAFHGHLLSEPELSGLKRKAVILIERWLAPRAEVLVTVGEKVARELLDECVGNTSQYKSIAPGVEHLELSDRKQVLADFQIETELPIVVWLARVTAVKAPHRVVELAKRIPEAFFVMAGGGDLLPTMKSAELENFRVLGWQHANQMWAIADVALSTSENEGMPVALIEAQLSGLPVVAIDVGSVCEVVEDGSTGYVVKEFGEEYVAKLRLLISDQFLRESMGKAARERAEKEFSPSQMIKTHIDLFTKLLKLD